MAPKPERRVINKLAFFVGLLSFLIASCREGGFTTLRYPGVVDFDLDNDGWRVSEGGIEYYNASEGNPGGYIFGIDNTDGVWYFIASQSFVSETRKSYDRTLSFDLEQSATDSQLDADDVIITDGKIKLTFNTSYHPNTTWTHYIVKLDEFSGWKKGNVKATKADMQAVLLNLNDLRIRGEFRGGPDQGGLDNVAVY